MPGLPLVVHETTIFGCRCNRPRVADQMCRLESRGQLTAEEAVAAEESLSVYCKPVELYNILQRRALRNPSFLQRCLSYKIQAKRKRRIQITVSLSSGLNDGLSQNIFPLHILVARPITDAITAEFIEYTAFYRVSQAFMLTAFSELGRRGRTEATFIIPEIQKLSVDSRSGDLTIIFFIKGVVNGFSTEKFPLKDPKREGHCLWGKFLVTSLSSSLEKSASLSLGHRVEMLSPIDMNGSIFEPNFLNQGNCLAFRVPSSIESQNPIFQAKVNMSAQEVGARERNPYDSYTYDDVPTAALPRIIRLRSGNVIFNYRYYNNTLQKTEVTEDFTCPFCLVQCASFKGVRYHLTSCHDLFNFEFWVTEEYQAVNVSVKADIWRSEIVADGVDPRLQTFFYCSRRKRRRRQTNSQNANDVHSDVKLDSPEMARDNSQEDGGSNKDERSPIHYPNDNHCQIARRNSESDVSENQFNSEHAGNISSPKNNAICASSAHMSVSNDSVLASERNAGSSAMLQFAKTRKLSVDRTDPRNRASLQKRQFFHSHRAQPMALEQVLSDRDSEDEVDDDIADFEDRRMLDDFVDVTKDEKHIMHLWNSFVRKQRVLADGHIPWACEAFTRLHGKTLVQSPALPWCWRLFMVKLWNHSLLDARTMNNCNMILQTLKNDSSDPNES